MAHESMRRISKLAAAVLTCAGVAGLVGAQEGRVASSLRLTAGDGVELVADRQVTQGRGMTGTRAMVAHGAALRYLQLDTAVVDGYVPADVCSANPSPLGIVRLVKDVLASEAAIAAEAPTGLLYEAGTDGISRLMALEYAVLARAWHQAGHTRPPALDGRSFALETTAGAGAWYVLQVWVGTPRLTDTVASWTPEVYCIYEAAEPNL